jgi:RNAse (barnase) inhibitor barstar
MKTIYLITESTGEYEDYRDTRLDATIDRDMAVESLKQLENEFALLSNKISNMGDHVWECEIEECKICHEYQDASYTLNEHNQYFIEVINIPEVVGELFSESIIYSDDLNKEE